VPIRRFPPAKKRLGQHFLHDPRVLDRIAHAACLAHGDVVVEIGAGTGELTRRLAERVGVSGRVLAVELDTDLLPPLTSLADRLGNVTVVAADILKVDIRSLLDEQRVVPPIVIVGNLPYYITTPVIERLLAATACWSSATLMVQDEVARRLTTPPGESGCGSISVLIHATAEATYCFRVGEGAFSPPPKVRSAVIRLTPWRISPVVVDDSEWLSRVSRAAFGQRRKTLLNALSTLPFDRDALLAVLDSTGIDPKRRGETLSLDEFARIANAFAVKSRAKDET
jgi:16S rRNA (adenine1518-N6/adenine1519-N6)-dimethyltransferase